MKQWLMVFVLVWMCAGCTRVMVPVNMLFPYMLIENNQQMPEEPVEPTSDLAQADPTTTDEAPEEPRPAQELTK